MTPSDHDYSAEERFERLLLDSARSDEVPRDTDAAWQKFDSALRATSLLAAGAGGALAVRRAQRWLAAKWLVCGAVAGSALTLLSLRPHRDRPNQTSPALAVPAALSASVSTTSSASASAIGAPLGPEVEAPPPETTPRLEKPATHAGAPRPPHASPPNRKPMPLPGSTLAAQVALLDAARSALAGGTFSEALRLADRYHTDFPNGELAPEAELVAIEALLSRGERAPALERATRFLARYPGDPHRARVKWLVR